MSGTPTTNTAIVTLATIDPPNIDPIELPVLLVYCSSHSGPEVPGGGKTKFWPTLIYKQMVYNKYSIYCTVLTLSASVVSVGLFGGAQLICC